MAITKRDAQIVTDTDTSHALTINPQGTNRCLYALALIRHNNAVSTLRFGGVDLTQLATKDNGTIVRAELWRLIAPTAGAASLVATYAAATKAVLIGYALDGVHQTSPNRVAQSSITGGTDATNEATITTALNEFVLSVSGWKNSGSISSSSPLTKDLGPSESGTGDSHIEGAGASGAPDSSSITEIWTFSSGQISVALHVSVQPASEGGGGGEVGPATVVVQDGLLQITTPG